MILILSVHMSSNSMSKSKVRGPRQNLRKRQGPARRGVATGSRPPSIRTVKVIQGSTRFLDSTGANGNFTVSDLLGLPGIVAGSTTTGFGIASTVRLKKVEVWSPVTSAGSTVSCTITDTSNSTGSLDGVGSGLPAVVQDSSVSFDHPAHIIFTPEKTRLSGMWLNSNMVQTQRLFLLQEPVGSIVDIHFEYVCSYNLADMPSVTKTLVSAMTGLMYKQAVIGGDLVPQGVNTI